MVRAAASHSISNLKGAFATKTKVESRIHHDEERDAWFYLPIAVACIVTPRASRGLCSPVFGFSIRIWAVSLPAAKKPPACGNRARGARIFSNNRVQKTLAVSTVAVQLSYKELTSSEVSVVLGVLYSTLHYTVRGKRRRSPRKYVLGSDGKTSFPRSPSSGRRSTGSMPGRGRSSKVRTSLPARNPCVPDLKIVFGVRFSPMGSVYSPRKLLPASPVRGGR